MSDLISRQDAIDAVETKIKKWNAVDGEGYHVGLGLRYTDVIDTLTELPSAQLDPCDVCAHKDDCGDMRIYCPAERRTDSNGRD